MIARTSRRVIWASPAEVDVAEAAVWYEDRQPGLGDLFLDTIQEAARSAAQSPDRYPRVHGLLRRVLVGRFPYGLIVQETSSELLVLACYHLHRDLRVWQSRG